MPPRRRSAAGPGVRVAALPPGGLLDWSASSHFAGETRPCRRCGAPTCLRDDKRLPSCKVCAEAELADIDRIVRVYSGQEQL